MTAIPALEPCPICGRQMAVPDPAAARSDTPPWLCQACGAGFWQSELTPEARAAFRPLHRDFGFSRDVAADVTAEHTAAQARGTSLVAHLLPLVSTTALRHLASRSGVDAALLATVDQELARRAAR